MLDSKFGSHLPILTRLVDMTDGPILELGMGIWSTPILDLMCKKTERGIASCDNDKKWFSENVKWKSNYHAVYFVDKDGWGTLPIFKRHWSVVLIDNRPAIMRRELAYALRGNADFILLHDSEPEIDRFYRYSSIYKYFKYGYDYTKCLPNTTVLSNFKDLSFLTK